MTRETLPRPEGALDVVMKGRMNTLPAYRRN
jgi:hypothetical protein